MTLKDLQIGDKVKIVGVNGEKAIKRRMLDVGVTRGTEVMVRKKAPLQDPIQIHVRGYELTLRLKDANNVIVEKI